MRLLRFILFPFSILYNSITSIRNKLFDFGIFKSTSFEVPVIVVGNLNVGGTGKTPQIEYLIRLLQNTYNVAVLSRGYKRKTKGFQIVNNTHEAIDVGDEPLQFFKKFENITVAVDADRTNGIQQLLKRKPLPEVILLDDAFQHRKVKAGYYILLTKYNDLFADDFLLPTGNLRESRGGAKRANLIVITKCPQEISERERQTIIKKLNIKKNQHVFFSTISYNDELKGSHNTTIEELKDKEVLLITGIANPATLLGYLKDQGVRYKHLKYPDHHHFSNDDLQKIKRMYSEILSSNKIILTTEKDYVRLQNKIATLYYIEIESVFTKDENLFKSKIQQFIAR